VDAVLVSAADVVASHIANSIEPKRSTDAENAAEAPDRRDHLSPYKGSPVAQLFSEADITPGEPYAVAAAE
jgi:hypothetical protein